MRVVGDFMNRIYYKLLKYKYFYCCKDSYPYLEDTDRVSLKCKKNIKIWLNNVLTQLNKNNIYLYEFENKICIDNKTLINENFLFYSIEDTMIENTFILSSKKNYYLDMEDWYNNGKNELIIQNDDDGIGLWIIGRKELFSKIFTLIRKMKYS